MCRPGHAAALRLGKGPQVADDVAAVWAGCRRARERVSQLLSQPGPGSDGVRMLAAKFLENTMLLLTAESSSAPKAPAAQHTLLSATLVGPSGNAYVRRPVYAPEAMLVSFKFGILIGHRGLATLPCRHFAEHQLAVPSPLQMPQQPNPPYLHSSDATFYGVQTDVRPCLNQALDHINLQLESSDFAMFARLPRRQIAQCSSLLA